MGSTEIAEIVTPCIQQNLIEANYNRIQLVSQYITHYKTVSAVGLSALQALCSFIPDISTAHHGSSCYGLTYDLKKRISIPSVCIPAILPPSFQQKFFHKYSHAALIIAFENPLNPQDKGYALIDPGFDLDQPIIILENGDLAFVDAKDKGNWTLQYASGKIICKGTPKLEQNREKKERLKDFEMIYETREYLNPIDTALKPMIAADRKIPLISRDKNGNHLAHLNLLMDKQLISWAIGYEKQPLITFQEFLSGQFQFSQNFAELLSMTTEELTHLLKQVIDNADILQQLYNEYTQAVLECERSHEFSP